MKIKFLTTTLAVSLVAFFSCQTEKSGKYSVNANIDGVSGSDIVMMVEDPSDPRGFKIDTLKATSDSFELSGTIDTVRVAMITVDDPKYMKMTSDGPVPVMPVQFFVQPNSQITIKGEVTKMHLSEIAGTLINKQLNQLIRETEQQQTLVDSIVELMRNAQLAGLETPELRDQIRLEYGKLIEQYANFVKNNSDLDIAPFVIKMYIAQFYEISKIKALYETLSERVKNTNYGKLVAGDIYSDPQLETGNLAPDFTINDKENKVIRLSDFRGRYLIIDFWGSWCKPCRLSHPKLVEAIEKYKAKELQIIGIAADRDNEEWLTAIEEDNLEWLHANALANQSVDILSLYSVRAFPTKFVIDPQGVITGVFIGDDPNFYTHLDSIFK